MRHYLMLIFTLLSLSYLNAQNTVGLLSYNANKSLDGYNLIYPHNQPNTYLLDNCGEIVHVWEGQDGRRPGNTAYIREDGRLVRTSRLSSVANDVIWAGGGGAYIEIVDWDGNVEYEFHLNDSLDRLHHDIELIEKPDNKFNILAIAWESIGLEEIIAAGRDTSDLDGDLMWPDYILELDPETNEIVWEWHAFDHLVQDFDSTKNNYGSVSEEFRRIDINYDQNDTNPDALGHRDWMHSNGLDYDPINDYIMISVPTFHEIWIIDHTTTTEQAATGSGGNSGVGGDLMFRWGNPAASKNGTAEDQKLFYQHDPNFINTFVDVIDPNYNKIMVFNNRVTDSTSQVNMINSGFDMYKWSFLQQDGVFNPTDFELTIEHPEDPTLLHSTGLSSAQYLNNGNFLITVGRFGYALEVTPDNEIVWEYKTPIIMGAPATQGDTLTMNNNLTFRMQRYPTDYAAFEGRDLSQKGWIELEPDSLLCDQLTPVKNLIIDYGLNVYPNPADDMITVSWDEGKEVTIDIFDYSGRKVMSPMTLTGGRKYINTSEWNEGIYIVRINNQEASRFILMR